MSCILRNLVFILEQLERPRKIELKDRIKTKSFNVRCFVSKNGLRPFLTLV